MNITGTHFNYHLVCHRKLWLFSRGISLEGESELVYEGKLIHEESYPRRSKRYQEIELEGIKIDYFDSRDRVIHEIKKSDRFEDAHLWQLKYYIFVLLNHGIENVTGILEYPRLHKREPVILTETDIETIKNSLVNIRQIITSDQCPDCKKIKSCRNCSYFDFCWCGEQ